MDKLVQSSVDNFVKELEMRIRILQSSNDLRNLDADSYNEVQNLISEAINRPSNTLKTIDLVEMDTSVVANILEKIGTPKDLVTRIKANYPNRVRYFKTSLNKNQMYEAIKFFEEVKKMIDNYTNDFQDLNTNQEDMRISKVKEYQSIISMLKEEDFVALFDSLDELQKLMSNLAIATEDKWRILEYIANQNIGYGKKEFFDVDIAKALEELMHHYIDEDKEVALLIQKKLELIDDIDIDLIPELARVIANDENLGIERTQNIICTYLLSSLFETFKKAVMKDESEEFLVSIKEDMDSILAYCNISESPTLEENSIIKEARIMALGTREFYMKHQEEFINQYVDLSINEIMRMYTISREEAIDLKTLPVLKSINETLEKLERITKQEDDYNLCCGVLDELISAYNHLVDKKDTRELKKE